MSYQDFTANPPGAGSSPNVDPPRRPPMLELGVWAWFAASILMLVPVSQSERLTGMDYYIGLGFWVGVALLSCFGCLRCRAGSSQWRTFFVIISVVNIVLLPVGFFAPGLTAIEVVSNLVMSPFIILGLVCVLLPESRQYFKAVRQYRRMMKAQSFAQFMRDNPPPESVRRKIERQQRRNPHVPPPGNGPHW
jgi:hypothetical protein